MHMQLRQDFEVGLKMSHRAVKYIKKVGHFNPAVPQRVK